MAATETEEKFHGIARLQIRLAQMDGRKIDRKVCRYNEIVETAMRYGRLRGVFDEGLAREGLTEAIDCCISGDPMHTGRSCITLVPDWMLPK